MLADNLPMNYKSTLRKSAFEGSELQEAGGINLGATHAQVGAYLLWLWNLPDLIITAAVYHHNPQDHPAKKFAPVTAVHLANGFDHEMRHLKTESKAPEINIEYSPPWGSTIG